MLISNRAASARVLIRTVLYPQLAPLETPYPKSSPAASPRSPHRSPRRSVGLQLDPAPRGPPWGEKVTLGPLLGRGTAGNVYHGLRNGKPVVVKVQTPSLLRSAVLITRRHAVCFSIVCGKDSVRLPGLV